MKEKIVESAQQQARIELLADMVIRVTKEPNFLPQTLAQLFYELSIFREVNVEKAIYDAIQLYAEIQKELKSGTHFQE